MSKRRKLVVQQQDLDPFRKAEKKYKLYKNVKTDFTNVIDLYELEKNTPETSSKIEESNKEGFKYFSFRDVPGNL
jgi:hypothetical protein